MIDQKKLYRTIDSKASKNFATEEELLADILIDIVEGNDINVTGGRLWKISPENKSYRLVYQTGNVQKIADDFLLALHDYPVLQRITTERTILADETNKTLISKGIFKYSASGIGSKVKVGEEKYYKYLIALNSSNINEDLRDTLNIVATVLTAQLKERAVSLTQKNLIADIDEAKQLQKSILPEHEYSFFDYNLFGITLPADNLGGDFFDYLQIGDDEDRLGITVGDAASHGIAAAAEAMYISGAVRMASTFQIKISPFMNRINQLVNKIFSDDKFTSLFYGEISRDKKGLFLYANAGHNPPLFISSATKKFTYLNATGPLLGPAPNSRYETDSINFAPNDVLVIYSDGITEAANQDFEFYEEGRLEKVVLENSHLTPREIVYKILDDVMKFSTPKSKYQDDKTLVVIKRKDKYESG